MATYWKNSCSFGLRYVSWYKYLIVSLVFSHLGFWSGNLFLIAPFPDLCLLVPFFKILRIRKYENIRIHKLHAIIRMKYEYRTFKYSLRSYNSHELITLSRIISPALLLSFFVYSTNIRSKLCFDFFHLKNA